MQKLLFLMLFFGFSFNSFSKTIDCDGFMRVGGQFSRVELGFTYFEGSTDLWVTEISVNYRRLFDHFDADETNFSCYNNETCYRVGRFGNSFNNFQINFPEGSLESEDSGFFTANVTDNRFFGQFGGIPRRFNCRAF